MTSINNIKTYVDIKDFWEKCDTTFAHITIDKHLKNYDELTNNWDKYFLVSLNKIFSLHNSTVIDYGIGGGYLGVYLFEKYKISKYVGIDISERQIKYAHKNLQKINLPYELILAPVDFSQIKADVFISQAVIQHFPDALYLYDFITNLNNSKIPIIMLQIRYDKNTKFAIGQYNKIQDVVLRCYTNNEYIQSKLNNYYMIYNGPILKNKYQFLIYKLKE